MSTPTPKATYEERVKEAGMQPATVGTVHQLPGGKQKLIAALTTGKVRGPGKGLVQS